MLTWFRNWLIRALGGNLPSEWTRLDQARNLLCPLDSCSVASKRVALNFFTKRVVSKYSGTGARTATLTLTFFGVPLFEKDAQDWHRFEWDLSRPDRVQDALSQLLIFTDKSPGGVMGRLDPDEQALLILALTWLRAGRKT